MLYLLNRGDLSFCVTVVTFRGYRSFCLCKTITAQGGLFVVVISYPLIFFQHSQLKCSLFHPDRKNTYVLFKITSFTFFFLLIFFHFHCVFTANLYFGRLFLQRGAQCYKTIDFYQVPGLTFFMMPTPRRSECERGANFTFFKKVFLFFILFSCWLSGCSNVADLHQITAFGSRQGEFIGPTGRVSGRCFY